MAKNLTLGRILALMPHCCHQDSNLEVIHTLETLQTPQTKEYEIAFNVFDGDGSTLATPIKVNFLVEATGSVIKTVGINFGADGPGGCSINYPYSTVNPTSLNNRSGDYFRDQKVWMSPNTYATHFIQTLKDGATVDIWLETDPDYPNSYSQKLVKLKLYGPKASAPKQFELLVDNVRQFITTTNLNENTSIDIPLSGSDMFIYDRRSKTTKLYSGEDITNLSPIELTTTLYTSDYLGFSIKKIETGIQIITLKQSVLGWPSSLTANLKITTNHNNNTINIENVSLADLISWINSEDANLKAYTDNQIIQIYEAIAELAALIV